MPSPLTYHLIVLGCQLNHSDAERLATLLEKIGYKKTNDPYQADLIGVISCAVRQSAMDRIYAQAHKWNLLKEKHPLITLLTGCVLKSDKAKLKYKFDILLDMKDIQTLPKLLTARHAQISDFIPSPSYLSITPTYESHFKAYVPIMTGCNKFCTYCAVPYTRGPEVSRPAEEIYQEIKNLLAQGYKEIMLLGQNVNSYGQDVKDTRSPNYRQTLPTFAELLHEINSWPGDFWLRFTTSHPYDMSDELITVMAEGNHLVEYLNLPVQSGHNEILKKMNRHYTVEHYCERLAKIRKLIPQISLSTDIIVGFGNETDEQFQATADLMKKIGYDMAYISQYSPRPGTSAARVYPDNISKKVKTEREKILTEILKESAWRYNQKFLRKKSRVLIDGIHKDKLFGKNREFKTIKINSTNQDLIGHFAQVKVTTAHPWGLEGEISNDD